MNRASGRVGSIACSAPPRRCRPARRPGRTARHATVPTKASDEPIPPQTATDCAGLSASASRPPTSTAMPCDATMPEATAPIAPPRREPGRATKPAGSQEVGRGEHAGQPPQQQRQQHARPRRHQEQRQPRGDGEHAHQPFPQLPRHEPHEQPGAEHAAQRIGRHQQADHRGVRPQLRRVRRRQPFGHHEPADGPGQRDEHPPPRVARDRRDAACDRADTGQTRLPYRGERSGAGRSTRPRPSSAADARNVPASASSATPAPSPATTTPPRPNPTSWADWIVI